MTPADFHRSIEEYYASSCECKDEFENELDLQWYNNHAVQRVYQYIDVYGVPDMYAGKAGGAAVWIDLNTGDGLIQRLEVRDSQYTHTRPIRHMDYVFVTIQYDVKPCKAKNISKITGSAYYYPVGRQLTSSCNFIGAAIAALYVIKEYNEDRIGLEDARQTYGVLVNELASEWEDRESSGGYETPMSLTGMYSRFVLGAGERPHEVVLAPRRRVASVPLATSTPQRVDIEVQTPTPGTVVVEHEARAPQRLIPRRRMGQASAKFRRT